MLNKDWASSFLKVFPEIKEHEWRRLLVSELPQEKKIEIWLVPFSKKLSVFYNATLKNENKATLLAIVFQDSQGEIIVEKKGEFVPSPPLPEIPASLEALNTETQYWNDFSERIQALGAGRILVRSIGEPKTRRREQSRTAINSHWHLGDGYETIFDIIRKIEEYDGPGQYQLEAIRGHDALFHFGTIEKRILRIP